MISYTSYQDVIDHGVDYLGGAASEQVRRDVRRAALEAYRDLANAHNWTYLYTHGRIITDSMYDSTANNATMTYTHTGGTYERMATISGGTWPTWAAGGYIRSQFPSAPPGNNDVSVDLSSVISYKVAERKSATVVTFDPLVNPGFDIAAGTQFQLFRDTYLLPDDYIAQDQSLFERNFGGMTFQHPREWLYENRYVFAQGIPQFYTITGDTLYPGRLVLKVYPWPYETRTIDFLYKRRPRPLVLESVTRGTVTIAGGSSSVTSSVSAFTSAMVGSVIRFSATALKPPTSQIFGTNPPVFESVIKDLISDTAVTLQDAAPSTLTGVSYTVSDIIDIEQGAMLNAYYRGIEKHISMNRTLKDKPSAALQYKAALSEAKMADSRSFAGRAAGQNQRLAQRLRDMPIDLNTIN